MLFGGDADTAILPAIVEQLESSDHVPFDPAEIK